MEKVISIKDLNFYYENKKALINANMDIEKNKVIALIGTLGGVKSTFLRCINRMNDLIDNVRYKGSIKFEGSEVLELKKSKGSVPCFSCYFLV